MSTVVVIPIYQQKLSEFERISLQRSLEVYRNRDICFAASASVKMEEVFPGADKFRVEYFDAEYFKSGKTYSRLLISKSFYEPFTDYDYMLICQLDVFVFEDNLDFWEQKGYDNIGAPIFYQYTADSVPNLREKGNNGGYCLRHIKNSLSVLNRINFTYNNLRILYQMESSLGWKLFRVLRDGFLYNYKVKALRPILNEDMFWSIMVPARFPEFKAAPAREAASFCFDLHPRFVYEYNHHQIPMAIHAWWVRDYDFSVSLMEKAGISIERLKAQTLSA